MSFEASRRMSRITAGAICFVLAAAVAAVHWQFFRQAHARHANWKRLEQELPFLGQTNAYVSSQTCQSCHPREHASWHRTFHRTMTQVSLPENVLGKFDGTTIQSDGLAYRVFREGDQFWAEMPDPDVMMYVVQGGKKLALDEIPRVRLPVVMTTGSHHYQTYWVASERYDRLLQTLPLVYLLQDQRWIPREAAFMRGPDDAGRFITQWNHHCIRCHSTAGNPGLEDATGMLKSRVAELGIACEACHGPGQAHIEKHRNPLERYRLRLSDRPDATIVNPSKLDHRRSSELCGQCHGVYITRDEYAMQSAREGALYRPGEDLHQTRYYIQHPTADSPPERWEDLKRNPEFFRERWWDDGTILAGGREYTAMATSACFTRGELSCLSCHSMHESDPDDQLKPGMEGPASCTSCHREPRFTSEITQHTFHQPASEGSNCLNCHMPHTTYALLKAIRSHQIMSPSVNPSARFGTPNACNLCHLDQSLAWTQKHLVERYGYEPVPLDDDQQSTSAALLWLLKGNAAQRVIAGWHAGWRPAQEASGADWIAPFLSRLLNDPYGVVRYVAARSLRALPGWESFEFDFLAPEPELQKQAQLVRDQWAAPRSQPLSRSGSEVLLEPEGRVMEERVQDLLRRRDNRSVTIKE